MQTRLLFWALLAVICAGCGLQNPYRSRDPKEKVRVTPPDGQTIDNSLNQQPRPVQELSTSLANWERQFRDLQGQPWPIATSEERNHVSEEVRKLLAQGPFLRARPQNAPGFYSITSDLAEVGSLLGAAERLSQSANLNAAETCFRNALIQPAVQTANTAEVVFHFGHCIDLSNPNQPVEPNRVELTEYQSSVRLVTASPAPLPTTGAGFLRLFPFSEPTPELAYPLHTVKANLTEAVEYRNHEIAAKHANLRVFALGASPTELFQTHYSAAAGAVTLNGTSVFLDLQGTKVLQETAGATAATTYFKTRVSYTFHDFIIGGLATPPSGSDFGFSEQTPLHGTFTFEINDLVFLATAQDEPCILQIELQTEDPAFILNTYSVNLCR